MKVVDKKVGDKTYIKYRINLPIKVVEETELLNKDVKVISDKKKILIVEAT